MGFVPLFSNYKYRKCFPTLCYFPVFFHRSLFSAVLISSIATAPGLLYLIPAIFILACTTFLQALSIGPLTIFEIQIGLESCFTGISLHFE